GAGDGALGRVSRAPKAAGAAGRLKGGLVRQEPTWSPDHPDPALGAALWAALSPRDDGAAFVARALARAAAAGVGTWRAVLGRWSRLAGAVAALLATFAAGGLLGWAVGMRAHGAGPRGWASRGGGPPGPDGMVGFLSERLDLTAAQRDSVRAILERHRADLEKIWREVHP